MAVRTAPPSDRAGLPLAPVSLALVARGSASLLLGLLSFAVPLVVLFALGVLFAGLALAWAVSAVVMALALPSRALRWILGAEALLAAATTVAGLTASGAPSHHVLGLIGAWAAITGLLECAAAGTLPRGGRARGVVAASGALVLLLGVVLVLRPLAPPLTVAWLLSSYAVAAGALAIVLAFSLPVPAPVAPPRGTRPSGPSGAGPPVR